jgi:hypothetical protein
MSKPREQRLSGIVSREAMHWGNDVAVDYHSVAASHMDHQWKTMIWPILARHEINLSTTMDFACGYGRNAKKKSYERPATGLLRWSMSIPKISTFAKLILYPLAAMKRF